MDQDTQKNAALVMDAAHTAEALHQHSGRLSAAMSRFKTAAENFRQSSRGAHAPALHGIEARRFRTSENVPALRPACKQMTA